jgi:putative inorganic carbon (hco3(-)) transporter
MFGAIAVILLTGVGSLVALFRPYYGLLVYIGFSVLKPEAIWGHALPGFAYSRCVAIALLLGWLLAGCGSWQLGKAGRIVAAFIALWSWGFLSTLQTPYGSPSWVFPEAFAKILLPFLVGVTTIKSTSEVRQVIWVILLAQGYVAYEFNVSYFTGYNTLQKRGFAGMDNNTESVALVCCFGIAFFMSLYAGRWWHRLTALVCAVLMGHAILFSFSRGGLLALIVTGAVCFLLMPKKLSYCVVFALAVLVGVRLAGKEVTDRFVTAFAAPEERDESANMRIQQFAACQQGIRDYPLLGVGPYRWPEVSAHYGAPMNQEAHNTWMQFAAELGIPGFLLVFMFYGLAIAYLLPLLRKPPPAADPWPGYLARMIISGLVGFAVAACFVTLNGLETPYYLVMVAAVLCKLRASASTEHQSEEQGLSPLLGGDGVPLQAH